MFIFKRLFIACIVILLHFWSSAQNIKDTLSFSVGLQDLYQYEAMYNLLGEYRLAHPNDVNIEWLYAQAAFYTGRKNEMQTIYEANIQSNPYNYYLQLDYAFKLTDIGKLNIAKHKLVQYLATDTLNPKIYEYLAKIEYWQSNHKEALRLLKKAMELSVQNGELVQLKNDIVQSASPWVSFGGGYFKDNQPLSMKQTQLQIGSFVNQLLTPQLNIESKLFDSTQNALRTKSFGVQNSAYVPFSRTRMTMGAGAFFYPNNSGHFIWNIEVNQAIVPTLKLGAKIERKPYLLLYKNIDSAILNNENWIGITREKKDGVNAQLAYQSTVFDDGNAINTIYGWFIIPFYVHNKFSTSAGYGYSNTSSKEDIYTHKYGKNRLFKEIFLGNDVEGHFPSYVTPMHQKVHSLIGVVSYNPNKRLSANISVSYGFDAKIETPFMYGYFDENFELIVERGYYTEQFKPLEINAKLNFSISSTLLLNAEYKRSYPNYYYQTDFFQIGIKKILAKK